MQSFPLRSGEALGLDLHYLNSQETHSPKHKLECQFVNLRMKTQKAGLVKLSSPSRSKALGPRWLAVPSDFLFNKEMYIQLISLGKLVNSSTDDRTIPQRGTHEYILWGGDCPTNTFHSVCQ